MFPFWQAYVDAGGGIGKRRKAQGENE